MKKLLIENPFYQFEQLFDSNLTSNDHSFENILNLAQIEIPALSDDLFISDETSIPLNDKRIEAFRDDGQVALFQTIFELETIINNFWAKKLTKSLDYYSHKKNKPRDNHKYKILLSTLDVGYIPDLPKPNEGPISSFSVFITTSTLSNIVIRNSESIAGKMFSLVLDSLLNAEQTERIYTKFTQTQLGLLSKILAETHGDGYGFTNLSKTKLDKLLATAVHTEMGPIGNAGNLNKVTFGSVEVKVKDIDILSDYFVALLNKLGELNK
jgi:hypothetical protein